MDTDGDIALLGEDWRPALDLLAPGRCDYVTLAEDYVPVQVQYASCDPLLHSSAAEALLLPSRLVPGSGHGRLTWGEDSFL